MDMSIRFPGLGLEFEYVPRAFRIYGWEVSVYGILIAAGMLIGLAFMLLEAKRAKENPNQCLMVFIWSVFGGVIGARLFYAAFTWKLFQENYFELLRVEKGGMAVYGGILGAVLLTAIYCGARKVSFSRMADYASIGAVTAQFIGRWGDFFNRESFGEYTDSIFCMQLPLASVRASEVTSMMRENLITVDGVSYILVHPTFLYESAWCLLLLLVLLWYLRRRKFNGEIFMRYLAGYALGRFFIEWLRTDKLLIPVVDVPVSMAVSVILFAIFGTVAFVERSMMKKREKLRKRRNEAYYEAEERWAAEYDAKEAALEEVKDDSSAEQNKDVNADADTDAVNADGEVTENMEGYPENQYEKEIMEEYSEIQYEVDNLLERINSGTENEEIQNEELL